MVTTGMIISTFFVRGGGLWCLPPLSINNISVISWQSVLLVEETGVPGEKPPNCGKSYFKRGNKTLL